MLGYRPALGTNVVGEKRFVFKLALDGAVNPVLSGAGASVARTAAGVFVITLADLPNGEFKAANVTLCKATNTLDLAAQFGGYDPVTGKATVLTSSSSLGALADPPAAAATNLLFVTLTFGSPVA